MGFIKKLKALPEVLKGIKSRTERGKGEAKKLVSLLLDLSGPQRGHVFDLRASLPLSGFLHGLNSSRPFSTPLNRLGFAITLRNFYCPHTVKSTFLSMTWQVLGNPASAPSPFLLLCPRHSHLCYTGAPGAPNIGHLLLLRPWASPCCSFVNQDSPRKQGSAQKLPSVGNLLVSTNHSLA